MSSEAERLAIALDVIADLQQQVEAYYPFVEAVAHQRYPFTAEDEVTAMELMRERQQRLRFAKMTPEQQAEEAALRG